MTRVIIIGGGFAGLAAARRIAKAAPHVDCTLIDRKETLDFLPMLPDLLSRRVAPELLQYNLAAIADGLGIDFLQARVTAVDLARQRVTAVKPSADKLQGQGSRADPRGDAEPRSSLGLGPWALDLPYDCLVIASGSRTDFHGRDDLARRAFTIDSVAGALRVFEAVRRGDFDTVVVVGGGYTGIEVATNLRRYFRRHGRAKQILVVEHAPGILSALDPWIRNYVRRNLHAMEIDLALGASVKDFADGTVTLSDGRTFERALLIWTAGVRTVDFVQALDVEKCPQGRLKVDEYLRLAGSASSDPEGSRDVGCATAPTRRGRAEREHGWASPLTCVRGKQPWHAHSGVFVAGDAACVVGPLGRPMRMAVQVSLDEGACAGGNVVRAIQAKPLRRYRPIDLGWLVPMANGRSCGRVLGLGVRGPAATSLHYLMCLFRSMGLRRRFALLKDLLQRRG